MTDQAIIEAYRKDSDKRWVGMLYKRYAHLVLGLCFKYLRDKAQAEDATADLFMSLYEKLKKHEVKDFRPWLYVASRNHCLMILRRQKNGKSLAEWKEEPQVEMNAQDLRALKEDQLELMEQVLGELPGLQGKCVSLFYLKSKSYDEISEALGIEKKTVKSNIQNGRRNLKLRLSKYSAFDEK